MHGACTDVSQVRLHTNESVQKVVKCLEEQNERMSSVQFSQLETQLGYNWKPSGLLRNPTYGLVISESITFDWFHVFLVHGIANREFALLWAALKGVGLSTRLETFLASFEWPKQFQGWKPNKIFGKRDTSMEPLKCSASELLSAYGIIRVFIKHFVWEDHPSVRPACKTSLRLCEVLDHLTALILFMDSSPWHSTGTSFGSQSAIWHFILVSSSGVMGRCYHALPMNASKRFGNPINNFTQSFEKSILSDIIHVQVRDFVKRLWFLACRSSRRRKLPKARWIGSVNFWEALNVSHPFVLKALEAMSCRWIIFSGPGDVPRETWIHVFDCLLSLEPGAWHHVQI